MFHVKEIYYTLQGEGSRTGRPSVFCRFSGCNLWTGIEADREKSICSFCDTDFLGTDGPGGGKHKDIKSLINKIDSEWPKSQPNKYVVFTGGEPALQITKALVYELQIKGFEVAIETNGTLELPDNIDWVTVSPKADTKISVTSGNELKLVFPQTENNPDNFIHMDFEEFYLQPKDGDERNINTQKTIQYCLENPEWKLSLQTHKYMGIP
jgi:7-carboxy-7-deazaguanine synthase (Cx14CxxC type)